MAEGAKPNSSLERPLWYSPESSRSIKTFGAGLVCAIGAIVALGALAALLPNADKIPLINHFAQIPSDIFYPSLTLVLFITAASGWYCKKSFSSEVKPDDSAPPTQETTETSATSSSTERAPTPNQAINKKVIDEKEELLKEEEFKNLFGEEYFNTLYQGIEERLQNGVLLQETVSSPEVEKKVVILARRGMRRGQHKLRLDYFWGGRRESTEPHSNTRLENILEFLKALGYEDENDLLAGETTYGADHEFVKKSLTQSGYDECVKPPSPVGPGQYRICTADSGYIFFHILYLNKETRFFRTKRRCQEAIERSGCYAVRTVEKHCDARQRIMKESQKNSSDTKSICEDPTMAYEDSEFECNNVQLVIFYYRKDDEIIWDHCKQEDITTVLQSKNLTLALHTP